MAVLSTLESASLDTRCPIHVNRSNSEAGHCTSFLCNGLYGFSWCAKKMDSPRYGIGLGKLRAYLNLHFLCSGGLSQQHGTMKPRTRERAGAHQGWSLHPRLKFRVPTCLSW